MRIAGNRPQIVLAIRPMSSPNTEISGVGVWATTISPRVHPVVLVIVASAAILAPAVVLGIPSNKDLTNHFRFALPFYDAIRAGDFYPGWLAESNSGYGDPSFRFYPPALYYLLALARILSGNWYSATLATFGLISFVSGFGIYFWAKSVLPARTAMWAALFYALAPYHVNQLYQATLLSEYAGAAVLPFVFYFVERVCQQGNRRNTAALAASYAVLVLTHLPLAIIGSFALLVYALTRVEKPHRVATLARLSFGAGLGLCASAFYWVTMAAEISWIGINNAQPDASVDYRNNFLLSTFSPDNLNVWWMNILALMTLLLFTPSISMFTHFRREAVTVKRVTIVTLFGTFMALPLAQPIWRIIPPLQHTQFPWRWLALVSMGGSILSAAGVSFWLSRSNCRRTTKLLVFGAVLISVVFTLSHTVREAEFLSPTKFEAALRTVRGSASVNYWFPVWASSPTREMAGEVAADGRIVAVNSWGAERRKFEVSAGAPTEARVRTFYYPHWVASSQGQTLPTRPDQDGALLISLPAESTVVDFEFREPVRTRISLVTSAAAWLLIAAFLSPIRLRVNR